MSLITRWPYPRSSNASDEVDMKADAPAIDTRTL